MSDILWPTSLPQRPLRTGYKLSPKLAVIETSMDVGPTKRRRRTTTIKQTLTVSYVMTTAQVTAFRTFVDSIIGGGALRFLLPDPVTEGATLTVALQSVSESSRGPGRWTVECQMEVST